MKRPIWDIIDNDGRCRICSSLLDFDSSGASDTLFTDQERRAFIEKLHVAWSHYNSLKARFIS